MNFTHISSSLRTFLQFTGEHINADHLKYLDSFRNYIQSDVALQKELSFDQPYTILQKYPINSTTFIIRTSFVIAFLIIIDLVLLFLYFYKNKPESLFPTRSRRQSKFDTLSFYTDTTSRSENQ